MPVQLIDVPIYNTTMRIPVAYLKGYQHPNCYPGLIPGKTAYSGILEQRAQACLLRWYLSVNPASIFPPLFIDVGCADGVYSVLAKQRGFEVIGFDPVNSIGTIRAGNASTLHSVILMNRIFTSANGERISFGYQRRPMNTMRKSPLPTLTPFPFVQRLSRLTPKAWRPRYYAAGLRQLSR